MSLKSDNELQTHLSKSFKDECAAHLSQLHVPTKNMKELEAELGRLDRNLETVLEQINSIKETRDELHCQTKKLENNLLQYGGESGLDKEKAKMLEVANLEMKKRENILKELEKRELVLSHSMLAIINRWANELESNFRNGYESRERIPELTEIYNNKSK